MDRRDEKIAILANRLSPRSCNDIAVENDVRGIKARAQKRDGELAFSKKASSP